MFRIACFALSLLLSGAVSAKPASEAEYQAKIKELQETMTQLQKELSAVKSNRDDLHKNLQQSEVDISELVKKTERLKQEIDAQKKQLAQLNQDRDELREKKHQQQDQISRQINTAYRLGGQNQLKLILNQQEPDKIARLLKYYDYFLSAHVTQIDSYLEVIGRLDALEPAINAKTLELEQSRQQLDNQIASLGQSQEQRRQTLKQLDNTIANKDQELKQKTADRQRLEKLLKEVTEALTNITLPGDDSQPFSKKRGQLPWPLRGKILKGFGSYRDGGGLNWQGVLISASEGQSVTAVHHGRVVFADYLRGQGMLLIIDHGGGYMSLYAHNQSLLKETGDWVSGGDPVARAGNTGGIGQTALYFEIRQRGKPVNPALWWRS